MLPWQPLKIEVVVGYTLLIYCVRLFSTCYEHFLTVAMVTLVAIVTLL